MSVPFKVIYRLNTICIKILTAIFSEKKKANPQIYKEFQGALDSQNNLEKEE